MNHLQFWVQIAAYYRARIEDTTLRMYAQDVSKISVQTLTDLFEKYRRDPKNKFMPMPGWFLETLNPTMIDPKDQAREISSRIQHAISKFGWPNPDQAKYYIGDIGWKVVDRYGGWMRVCEMVGVDVDASIFLAQTRDLAESMVKNQGHASFDQPVNFIERDEKKSSLLKGSNDLLRVIGLTKDE